MIHPSDGQTDRQTDERTDGRAIAYSALSRLSHAKNKKAQLMLAYPRDAKTMKKIPPFRSHNKFQSSRKSGVYSN